MCASKAKEPSKNPLKHYSICSWIDPSDTRIIPDELCDLKGLLKILQKKTTKGPAVATYNLRMRSSVKGKTTTVELPCSILPDTVRALKAEIEEQHSVPVQLQIISYNNGETLTDDLTLESIGVKTRDTLEVSYTCEAEVQKIKRVLAWVDYISTHLHERHPTVSTGLTTEVELLANMGLNERLLQRLANNYFSPPDSARVQANKTYFHANEGVSKLVRLLGILTDPAWADEVLHMKLLEAPLLDALRGFATGDEGYTQVLVDNDVPGFIVMMMTRMRLVPYRPVEDLMGSPGVKENNDVLVLDMMSSVLEIMWTMRRHKEQFTDMTSLHVCTENLVFLAVSPSMTNRLTCIAIYTVLIRLCWIESVVDLGQASAVMLEVARVREEYGDSPEEVMVAKYFSTVYVAWKTLHNVNHLKTTNDTTRAQLRKTYELMKDFLATCDREALFRMVGRYELAMFNLLPMFGLLFHPKNKPRALIPDHGAEFVLELDTMCAQCLIVHLEVVMSQQCIRDTLPYKDTDQHIVVFPWWLPSPIRESAERLKQFVHSFKPLPVPKLSIIARARLARFYLEFDKLQKEKSADGTLEQLSYPDISRYGLPLMRKNQDLYVFSIP